MPGSDPQAPAGRNPQRTPPGLPRQRPARPRPRPRGPYYRASLWLSGFFVLLALGIPIWIDQARRGADENAPAPAPTAPVAAAVPKPQAPVNVAPETPAQVNTMCRGYVYARCNTLYISPQPCLRIVVDAMAVPIEKGMDGCREAVEPRIREAALAAGRSEAQIAGKANPAALGEEQAAAAASDAPDSGPSATARDVPLVDAKATLGEGAAKGGAGGDGAAAKDKKAEPSPQQRVEALQQMETLVDELQRGGNNYATSPAIQAERLAKLKALAEAEGSDDAKRLYNDLVQRYARQAPPSTGAVGESPAVETRNDGAAAATTAEGDRLRSLVNAARDKANLPPAPAQPSRPAEAAPTSAYESPAQAAPGEVPSSAAGAAQEYRP